MLMLCIILYRQWLICWWILAPQFHYGCIVYDTASNTNLRQLDSIHNTVLRLALGAFCTSPVSSLYTEANEATLEERRLKLSMHYYLKTRAFIDNPAHHALHEFDRTTRELCPPAKWERGYDATSSLSHWSQGRDSRGLLGDQSRIGLPPDNTQLSTGNAQLWSQETQPHWRSECMITRQEAQAKFNEYHGSKMNEIMGAAAVINRHFLDGETTCCQLKTARQQHHLCCLGYSHHPGTEMLPVHGPTMRWSTLTQCPACRRR